MRASPQSAGLSFLNGRGLGRLDDLRQVEAKYPALLFKQQLTAFLEKIYGMIRDNLKKEISPLLGLCIQVRVKYLFSFPRPPIFHDMSCFYFLTKRIFREKEKKYLQINYSVPRNINNSLFKKTGNKALLVLGPNIREKVGK